jgi:hypothetical protein
MATPRAKSAAARTTAPPQAAPAQPAPAAAAPALNAPRGRAVALGRDGKPIWRHATADSHDPFAIDPSVMPDGWVWQWKRYSVYNQVDHSYQSQLQRVGKWTPVLAENTPDGMFLPPGSSGPVISEGLILMERPRALHEEAEAEEKMKADRALNKAKVERGLAPASAGIDVNTPAARNATYVKTTRALDDAETRQALSEIPRGAYEYGQSID